MAGVDSGWNACKDVAVWRVLGWKGDVSTYFIMQFFHACQAQIVGLEFVAF